MTKYIAYAECLKDILDFIEVNKSKVLFFQITGGVHKPDLEFNSRFNIGDFEDEYYLKALRIYKN